MALKAKIAASVASAEVQNMLEQSKKTDKPQLTVQEQIIQRQLSAQERELSLNLIIDSEGRTVDKRTGQVVQIQSRAPTIKANIKTQKREYRGVSGNDKNDLFASGIASTMSISSGVSSVYPAGGIQSTLWQLSTSQQQLLSSSAATPAAPPENVSEQFFDARLKFVFLFIYIAHWITQKDTPRIIPASSFIAEVENRLILGIY